MRSQGRFLIDVFYQDYNIIVLATLNYLDNIIFSVNDKANSVKKNVNYKI